MGNITRKLETLILGLVLSENRSFDGPVQELAKLFNSGDYEVHNPYTGELLNPSEYAEEIQVLLDDDVSRIVFDTNKSCLSVEASSLQSRQNECKCQELERQRRNLLFLVCRMLQDRPEYRLYPSALAAENVGDLSCLGQESCALLCMRMEKGVLSRTSTSDI